MRLADAYAISTGLRRMYGLDVPPGRIRSWATRGKIQRHGYAHNGWTLYDFDEVLGHARTADVAAAA